MTAQTITKKWITKYETLRDEVARSENPEALEPHVQTLVAQLLDRSERVRTFKLRNQYYGLACKTFKLTHPHAWGLHDWKEQ